MRKSKTLVAMALIASFGLVAAACGSDSKSSDTVAKSDLKVGIAFDTGGRGDGTFNDSAGRGADQAASDLGATVQELEATSDTDRQPNLEALTAAGNSPVIAVGFAFGDALGIVAAANPNTVYGWVDGDVGIDELGASGVASLKLLDEVDFLTANEADVIASALERSSGTDQE